MVYKGYGKHDSLVLKGFAILLIVFHNIFHHISPSPGENEFAFLDNAVTNFFGQLATSPSEFVNLLFSFFGHYGVQIFILVSGYGLAVSMKNNEKKWLPFVFERLKKLYPLLLVGLTTLYLATALIYGRLLNSYDWTEIKYKLLFIHTLQPDSGLSVCGPWWFFGLIFQLYLLFPLLYKLIEKFDYKAFWGICLLSYLSVFYVIYNFKTIGDSNIMMNAPGHLPEFCLGILLANRKGMKINIAWLFLALAVFSLGNFYKIFYPFSFVSITIVFVFAYQGFKNLKLKKGFLKKVLVYFGEISMTLFVVHGFLREPFERLGNGTMSAWSHVWIALLFFATALGVAVAAKHLYDWLCSIIKNVHVPENKFTNILGRVLQLCFAMFFIYIIYHYISINNAKYDRSMVNDADVVDKGIIDNNVEYVSLIRHEMSRNYHSLRIEGSVDVKNCDCNRYMPILILDIKDVVWHRFDIGCNNGDTTNFQTVNFNYELACPIDKSLKGKTLKLYFWNNDKGAAAFENADVKVLY